MPRPIAPLAPLLDPISERVRAQYERHPYPPASVFALPSRRPEAELALTSAAKLAGYVSFATAPRILVAGCGSLEALVIARANPSAREVVAIDLSEASLTRLGHRVHLARIVQPFCAQAPLTIRQGDLLAIADGPYDAIFLSNVLQHVPNPALLVAHLASLLSAEGLLRLVVYPRASRLWMAAIQHHLGALGLHAHIPAPRRAVANAMDALAADSPLRLSFDVNPESLSDAGVVDAFLHAHDEPMPLDTLAYCIHQSGLHLVAERQTPSSRSSFVDEVDGAVGARLPGAWDRLAVLDESLELCANPVFWLARGAAENAPTVVPRASARPGSMHAEGCILHAVGPIAAKLADLVVATPTHLLVPNPIGAELASRLQRLGDLLAFHGLSADDWLHRLAREVGPRVAPPPSSKVLPGLALSDYEPPMVRALLPAVPPADLDALEAWLKTAHGVGPLAGASGSSGAGRGLRDVVRILAAQGSVLAPVRVPLGATSHR